MCKFIAWFCFGGMIGSLASHKTDAFLVCLLAFTIAVGFSELCIKIEELGSAKSAQAENTEK